MYKGGGAPNIYEGGGAVMAMSLVIIIVHLKKKPTKEHTDNFFHLFFTIVFVPILSYLNN